MSQENLDDIMVFLEEVKEDNSISKNIREKIANIIEILSQDKVELSLRINKVMNILDDISDDITLPSYTRTQVWNIVSLLESMSSY